MKNLWLPLTWKGLIGKFYNCGILNVRRQIKNSKTLCERKFNFLSCDVLGFCYFSITYDMIIIDKIGLFHY